MLWITKWNQDSRLVLDIFVRHCGYGGRMLAYLFHILSSPRTLKINESRGCFDFFLGALINSKQSRKHLDPEKDGFTDWFQADVPLCLVHTAEESGIITGPTSNPHRVVLKKNRYCVLSCTTLILLLDILSSSDDFIVWSIQVWCWD